MLSVVTGMFLLLTMQSLNCNKEEDECEDAKWDVTLDYAPQPRLLIGYNITFYNDFYDIMEAKEILFSGTVEKKHCDGSSGGKYDYYSTFDPRILNDEARQKGIFVGYPINFKFQHDKDRLIVIYTLDVTWEDGAKAHFYDTQEIRYLHIREDFDSLKEYFILEVKYEDYNTNWQFHPPFNL